MLSFKVLFIIGCLFAITAAQLTGGVTKLKGEELKEARKVLLNSLNKLEAGDGPHYKLIKLFWATHQVVQGDLYEYNAALRNSQNVVKRCNVKIWSRLWLDNGNQVTFTCPGEKPVTQTHN